MARLTLTCKYYIDEGAAMAPSELVSMFMYGVKLQDKYGHELEERDVASMIKSAQLEVERQVDIKVAHVDYEETLSYHIEDFKNWGYIPTSFNVEKPLSVTGYFNDVKQLQYPVEWLASRKSSDGCYYRNIFLVPMGTLIGAAAQSILYSGITPHLNFLGQKLIPYYWNIKYTTGFLKTPADILEVIGKLAAVNLFQILGDTVLGAGISSMSLGVDGLSQSLSSTASSGSQAFSARIKSYMDDAQRKIQTLRDYYRGSQLTVC